MLNSINPYMMNPSVRLAGKSVNKCAFRGQGSELAVKETDADKVTDFLFDFFGEDMNVAAGIATTLIGNALFRSKSPDVARLGGELIGKAYEKIESDVVPLENDYAGHIGIQEKYIRPELRDLQEDDAGKVCNNLMESAEGADEELQIANMISGVGKALSESRSKDRVNLSNDLILLADSIRDQIDFDDPDDREKNTNFFWN